MAAPAGVSGQTVLLPPSGPALKPGTPAPPAGMLFLRAASDLPLGALNLTLRGRATVNGQSVVEYASIRALVGQNLAGLPFPPQSLDHLVGLAITPATKPPFQVAVRAHRAEAYRGGAMPLTVTLPAFTLSPLRWLVISELTTISVMGVLAAFSWLIKRSLTGNLPTGMR